MKSLVSIHDLMPDTLKRVLEIEQRLRNLKVPSDKVYLLVVPGLAWKPKQLATLKALQNDGYQLAGHGWLHHIHKKTSLKHYFHSAFISRNVAEHLSLSRAEITDMLLMNFEWFAEQGLRDPELYVPPAWAMGKMNKQNLSAMPFKYYEYSSGIYNVPLDDFRTLPLTGYEADRLWRVPILLGWNSLNLKWLAKSTPLRISIHPYDFEYYLKNTITQDIERSSEFLACDDLFAASV